MVLPHSRIATVPRPICLLPSLRVGRGEDKEENHFSMFGRSYQAGMLDHGGIEWSSLDQQNDRFSEFPPLARQFIRGDSTRFGRRPALVDSENTRNKSSSPIEVETAKGPCHLRSCDTWHSRRLHFPSQQSDQRQWHWLLRTNTIPSQIRWWLAS